MGDVASAEGGLKSYRCEQASRLDLLHSHGHVMLRRLYHTQHAVYRCFSSAPDKLVFAVTLIDQVSAQPRTYLPAISRCNQPLVHKDGAQHVSMPCVRAESCFSRKFTAALTNAS